MQNNNPIAQARELAAAMRRPRWANVALMGAVVSVSVESVRRDDQAAKARQAKVAALRAGS